MSSRKRLNSYHNSHHRRRPSNQRVPLKNSPLRRRASRRALLLAVAAFMGASITAHAASLRIVGVPAGSSKPELNLGSAGKLGTWRTIDSAAQTMPLASRPR
jgi:hypothetical protein